ncbi:ribonuclease T2 family protein [Sphingomonas quercus]|uniref:Ribonuclease T n=1 Tax=Sphingomonas quercus TaxID=2842451 RepID=A0ABS6BKX9_9SPHN|nr:ribonuclease T [Sphingomonas quercus]MBU3078960.1 ribonuclease T [Sphingomonas quercus]
MRALILALPALLAAPTMLSAQTPASCPLPGALITPHDALPNENEPRRVVPIGGYTLAISWSPEFCRGKPASYSFQCSGRARFGFVLHGLWPDGKGKDWPQYCAPTGIVSPRTIRGMMCATPSEQLIQHEWAKHGTCMPGETPESYFARSSAMYRQLRFPDMDRLSRDRSLTVGGFQRAFAAVNPGLRADMMRVTVTRAGWLDELWLCRDTRLRPVRCPAHQGGAAPQRPLRIQRGRA